MTTVHENVDLPINLSWFLIRKVAVMAVLMNKTFNEAMEIIINDYVNGATP